MRKTGRLGAPSTLAGDRSTSGCRPGAVKKARKSGDRPTGTRFVAPRDLPALSGESNGSLGPGQGSASGHSHEQLRLLGRRVRSDSMKMSDMVIVDREVVGCFRATARGERLSCRGRRKQKILGEQISSRSPPKIAINGEIRRPCD